MRVPYLGFIQCLLCPGIILSKLAFICLHNKKKLYIPIKFLSISNFIELEVFPLPWLSRKSGSSSFILSHKGIPLPTHHSSWVTRKHQINFKDTSQPLCQAHKYGYQLSVYSWMCFHGSSHSEHGRFWGGGSWPLVFSRMSGLLGVSQKLA